jgi:hypothetical protein
MGSGLVKSTEVAPATPQPAQVVAKLSRKPCDNDNTHLLVRQLSSFVRYVGMSKASTEEVCEERQRICLESWNLITNSFHQYANGCLSGTELFCKMLLSNIFGNDHTENRQIAHAFRPLTRSTSNCTRAAMIKRIVKLLLSVRHESRKAKQALRSLGRAHARIRIERPHFDVFVVSFIDTLIFFPGACIAGEHIVAWTSLLNFAVDQMCFDKIVFKDHCTLGEELVEEPVAVENEEEGGELFHAQDSESYTLKSCVSGNNDTAALALPSSPTSHHQHTVDNTLAAHNQSEDTVN